jgi:hypothetical protein
MSASTSWEASAANPSRIAIETDLAFDLSRLANAPWAFRAGSPWRMQSLFEVPE